MKTQSAMPLLDRVKHARRVSVPMVAIDTSDPAETIRKLAVGLNNGPMVQWDVAHGLSPVNEAGTEILKTLPGMDETAGHPMPFLEAIQALPSRAMAFMHQADAWMSEPPVRQAVWNLRDQFKANARMLVMLSAGMKLPPMLKDNVIHLDDPLPTDEELKPILGKLDAAACVCGKCAGTGLDGGLECPKCNGSGKTNWASLDDEAMQRSIEAIRGVPAFAAEQAFAMALRPKGVDLDHLWDLKRSAIEQTRGLSVYRGGETFDDLGGLDNIKGYLTRIMTGRRPPLLIVWLDEIEKTSLAIGQNVHAGNTADSDQLGYTLQYMEDKQVYGVMLTGVAGSGKSAIVKACGAEYDRIVLRLDMGAFKDSLYGEAEKHLRAAFRVITAVGSGRSMWLATCNSADSLDTALRSRFTRTFFFDLPEAKELAAIWKVWRARYPNVKGKMPKCGGWVGRNIAKCIVEADDIGCDLSEPAEFIVPQAVVEATAIEALRREADGKYLSATASGIYHKPKRGGGKGSRQVDVTA